MTQYVAILAQAGDGSWGAYVPDLPGCTSAGATRDEAARHIREAVEFHIEGLRELGYPVPPPTSDVELVPVA